MLARRSAARAAAARIIAIGLAMSLPCSAGAVPCGASAITARGSYSSSRASSTDSAPAIEPNSGITMSDRQSPSRLRAGITSGASAAPEIRPGVGGVDQHGGVGHLGMALGRGVHLLLEHALVDRADRPLGAAVDAPVDRRRGAEAVLGHGPADAARDALGAEGDLVAVLLLAPLLGAVGVADGHAHDGDRVVDAGHRGHAGDAAPGADDHLAVDRLAQDAVGAADVVRALGRDRGRLEAEAGLGHAPAAAAMTTSLSVRAPVVERQVVVLELDLHAGDAGVEHAQGLLEQLLAGLVSLEDDDLCAHARRNLPSAAPGAARRSSRDDGWRLHEQPRERARRRSAGSSTPSRGRCAAPAGSRARSASAGEPDDCARCGAPLGDVRVVLVRHRGEHRIPDAFCSVDHMADWAKSGGRWG